MAYTTSKQRLTRNASALAQYIICGEAHSHRYTAGCESRTVPVGAGLPAIGPEQAIQNDSVSPGPIQLQQCFRSHRANRLTGFCPRRPHRRQAGSHRDRASFPSPINDCQRRTRHTEKAQTKTPRGHRGALHSGINAYWNSDSLDSPFFSRISRRRLSPST